MARFSTPPPTWLVRSMSCGKKNGSNCFHLQKFDSSYPTVRRRLCVWLFRRQTRLPSRSYVSDSAIETRPYEGVLDALARLESKGIAWGVVTNKPSWLTEPLLEQFALRERARVIVSGDSLAERKPHPAPLQYAADKLGVIPAQCIYIGDAERDVLAAQAAGMRVFVALFGYIPADERPRQWPASGWLDSPQAITELLDSLIP